MRAKFINEQNFERGEDPKKTMDIGARKNAPVLAKIVFDAWDGGFVKKRYNTSATHDYLQKLADGNFDEMAGGAYRHPTRVFFYFEDGEYYKNYKDIAGKVIRYEDDVYIIPRELAELEWKRAI